MTRAGNREKTRLALLAAAREVIGECGIRAASVDAISRRAGVTKGAFYYAFASKPALLTELGRSTSVTLLDHGADLLNMDAAGAAAALAQAVAASRDELLFQVELWLYAARDDDMRRTLQHALVSYSGQLEDALRSVDAREAATTALSTRSLLLGLVLQMLLDENLPRDRVAAVLERHLNTLANTSGTAAHEQATRPRVPKSTTETIKGD